MGNTIFDNFAQKSQNYCFQLKFGSNINSNILNSIVVLTFSVLDGKHPFYANLVRKIKIVSLNWNCLIRLIKNLNMQNPVVVFSFSFLFFFFFWSDFFLFQMQNSVVVSSFSFLNWKHSFCLNLDQKFNFVSLNASLVPRLI